MHIDTGHLGGFLVGTHCEHVLAEGGLVPDHPHQPHQDQGVQHVHRHADTGNCEQRSSHQVAVLRIEARQGLSVVRAHLQVDQDDAVRDQLGGQRHDEGMQVEFRHGEPVDESDHCTGSDCRQQRDDDRQRLQTREDLVGGDGHTGHDDRRQSDHAACGNIGSGQDDASGDAQGYGQLRRGQVDDVDDRVHRTVGRHADRDEDHHQRDDDVHGVVHQQGIDGPPLVRRRHGQKLSGKQTLNT